MFLDGLSATSGMGGPLVLATISALLFTVGGRPQTNDYTSVSRPVIPFNRFDNRNTYVSGERQATQMEHRPHQGFVYSEEPFSHRVHSDQQQSSSVTNHDRQHSMHNVNMAKDRKRPEEQPVWLPKSETTSTQRRDGPNRPQVNPPHSHDKRGNSRPENRGPNNRGQPNNPNRPLTRMGTIEVPDEDFSGSRNESVGDTRRAAPMNTGEIVFPGPTRDPNTPKKPVGSFAPAPNCEEGSTFCESTDNYPSDYLNSVLKIEADAFKDFFGRDELNELTQRIDLTDETPLCPSLEQVVYPKMAQNKEDKWLYVVNQEPYVQGVRVEKCLKQESECSLTEGFPLGYKTVCRQKYIYRRMLALNEDGKTHSDMFRLPSCCACFVKTVGASTDGSA